MVISAAPKRGWEEFRGQADYRVAAIGGRPWICLVGGDASQVQAVGEQGVQTRGQDAVGCLEWVLAGAGRRLKLRVPRMLPLTGTCVSRGGGRRMR